MYIYLYSEEKRSYFILLAHNMLTQLKTKLPPKRYWAEYSYRMAKLLIESGFIFGTLPLVFKIHDPNNNRIQHLTSRLHRFRCHVCLCLSLSALLPIFAYFLRDLLDGKISFKDVESMFRAFVILSSFGGALFHLHTYWKIKPMVAFINGLVAYYLRTVPR